MVRQVAVCWAESNIWKVMFQCNFWIEPCSFEIQT